MSSVSRITCPSCGSSRFKHDRSGNLICESCGTMYASPRELILCATCGKENPPSAKKCMECGRRLEITCVNCGYVNPPGLTHCAYCASPLDVLASVMQRMNAQERLKQELVQTKQTDIQFLASEVERREAEQREKIALIQAERAKDIRRIRLYFAIGIGAVIFLFLAVFVVVLTLTG